jgi:hypothetical protein
MHSSNKIDSLKLYHLLNFTLHSKANACKIVTCFRSSMQMWVKKKAFACRIYSHFKQQCRVWLQCALHFLPTWFLKETFCECKWNELRQNCTTVKPGCQSVLSQRTVLSFVHFCLVPYIAFVFYLIWLPLPGLFWLATSFLNTMQICTEF